MRASLLVVPAYLAAAVVVTWPLATVFGTALPAVFNTIDPLLQAFVLGWDWLSFMTGLFGVFDAPIFHPERRTLAYMDHLLGEALVSGPVAFATGSLPAAYNTLVILSFAASGWAAYRLARWLSGSRAGSFVCGFLYAFGAYRMSNLGNLNQLQTQFVPLALLFVLRFAATRRTRDLAAAFATLAVQSYFGWYYAFHIAGAFALVFACAIVFRWPGGSPLPWRRVLVCAVLALLVMAPGAFPYWQLHASLPGFRRSLGKAAIYSADVVDYLRLSRENLMGKLLHLPRGDLAYAPGIITVALALVAWWRARAERLANVQLPVYPLPRLDRALVVIALSAFVLSLGPILKVAGQTLPVPLPYAVFYYIVPGFAGMRAPGRFAEIVLLIGAVFAARGYDVLRERAPGRVARGAMLVVVTAAMLATSMSTAIPVIEYPGPETMPAAWKWIAKQPGHFSILELPMPSSEADESERDAVRQIWTLYHGKARADGLSGFSSPAHEGFRALMQSFPERLAVRAIAERGVRYVIVRYGEYVPQDAARIRYDLASVREMAPVFESGSDVVYSLANAELLAEEGSRDIVKRYKRERASAGRRR